MGEMSENGHIVFVERDIRTKSLQRAPSRKLIPGAAEHGEVGVLAGQGLAELARMVQPRGTSLRQSVQTRRVGHLEWGAVAQLFMGAVS
ncbi:hypothetical protein PSDVSF_34130 [Pseudodesulfovibrio sediminis]|uniref:Uncharacterized protein n=1 Tax=Pseudodesulfovibrio sediminis TaxID=2810563 RepID=A0ABM7P9T0_9BACT|nr:hypothetical protein PSDVSF_34130 [Pseudodesulfovibrio sediminis]